MPAMRMAAWGHALAAAIGLGRAAEIEFLASRFEPFRGQHAANGAGAGVYMGPVELQLGLAAAALGRLDAAASDLAAAVSICDANGACGYAVQASVELAAVLVRRGDPAGARAVLDRAEGEASRLGMAPFVTRIEQLRAQLTADAGPAHPVLSPRELEVARLVAQGLTNKQRADVGGHRKSGDQQAEQRSSPPWLFHEKPGKAGMVKTRVARWVRGWRERQLVRRQTRQTSAARKAAGAAERQRYHPTGHFPGEGGG